MANPKEATVHPITGNKPLSPKELIALAKAKMAEAKAAEKEANDILQANADAFAQEKQDAREKAVKAVQEYLSLASKEEVSQFRRDLGMGRKGGKRQTKVCGECGKGRHGSKSTCSKAVRK